MEEKKGIKSFMAKVAEKAGKEFDESKADEFIKKYNNDYGKIVDDIGTNMGVKPERLSEFRERAFKEYAITAPTTPGVSPEEIPKTTDKARSFTNDYLDFNKAGHEYDIANKEIPKSQFDIQSPGKELRNQGPAYDEEAIIEAMPTLSKIENSESTWEGFGKELGLGLTFGGNAFNQLLADTPDFVNRFLVSQYNLSPLGQAQQNIGELIGRDWKMKAKDLRSEKFADYTKEQQSIIRKKVGAVNPKMEEDILAAIKKGDWITFTRNVARQVAESTASSIGIMTAGAATGGASMVGIGTAVFGAGKYREVDEAAPNMSEDKKVLISAANGALEGIFETTFGSAAVGKAFVKLIANEGKDVAKGIALKGLRKGFSDVILKYPAMAPLGEGFEEWGTQITQNYVDKLSGFRPDLDVMEGSTQAFIIGAAAGASHGAIIRGARIGQDAVATSIRRSKVKKQYEKSLEYLADIPNSEYTDEIKKATENISDPYELSKAFNEITENNKEHISEEDYQKALFYIFSFVQHNQMNNSRDDQIEANITKFQDKNGNVSKATIDGKVWYIQNPEDIGTGKVIFGTNEAGETKGFANQKVTEATTKTPDEIRNDVIMQDEFLEQEAEKQAAIQKEAADKGIVVNQTAVGPHGKGTVISINENGTVTIADTKGDTIEVQMNEVEQFKTAEQKAAEKEQEQAEKDAQDALLEGIEEGAEIESDEEQSGIRIVNFNNGQSKIITPEGEQILNTPEERDAALKTIVDEKMGEADAKSDIERRRHDEVTDSGRSNLVASLNNAKADRDTDPDSDLKGKSDKELEDIYNEGIDEINTFMELAKRKGLSSDKIAKRIINIRNRNPVLNKSKGFNNQFDKTAKNVSKIVTSDKINAKYDAELAELEKTKSDEVSIDDLNPEERYNKLLTDDAEIANEMLSEDIADIRANAKELRSAKAESQSEKLKNKKQAKVLDQEADRLEGILNGETQKIVDQAESLFVEMEQEKENAPINQLTEWQQEVLGESFSRDQFADFKDENEITATLARAWLNKTGTQIDTWVAAWNQGIEEGQYGGEQISPEDVVNFIVDNPSKNIRSTTGRMGEIRAEYKEATGKSIDNHEAFIKESGLTPQATIKTNDPQAIAYEEGIAKLKEAGYTDEQIEKINQTDEPGGVTGETLIEAPIGDVPFRTTEQTTDEKPTEQVSQVEGDVLPGTDTKEKVKRKRIGKRLEEDVKSVLVNISDKASEIMRYKKNALRAIIKIADDIGIKTNIIHSSEMSDAVKEAESKLAEDKKGVAYVHGEMYIISDRITSVSQAKKSYIHEAVVHLGLKGLFKQGTAPVQKGEIVSVLGKQYQKFNTLMLDIYDSMNEKERTAIAEIYASGKTKLTAEEKAYVAEEFMAYLSEQETIPTKWQEFLNKLTQIIRKTFNLTSKQFTQTDLLNIIREQRERFGAVSEQKLAESANIESNTLGKVPKTADYKADIQPTKKLVDDKSSQKEKPGLWGGEQKVKFRVGEQLTPDRDYLFDSGLTDPDKLKTKEEIADYNARVEIMNKLYENGFLGEDFVNDLEEEWVLSQIEEKRYFEEIVEEKLEELDNLEQEDLDSGEEKVEDFLDSTDIPVEMSIEEMAIQSKGLTDYLEEAGYILEDGRLLDFSGKRVGGDGGVRYEDHRQLSIPYKEDIESPTDAMNAFMNTTGAIRIDYNGGAIDMENRPTPSQERKIGKIIRKNSDTWTVDLQDGERKLSLEGGPMQMALDNIERFYSDKTMGTGYNDVIRFKVAESQQELDDFTKDSKVKETVYHGTKEAFDEFDKDKTMDGMFWFTSDKKAIESGEAGNVSAEAIMPVKLNFKNPAGWKEYESLMTQQIIDAGFDGIILDDYYVAFEPEQILIEPTDTKFRAQDQTPIDLKIEQLQKQRERIISEKNRLTKKANLRNGLFGDTQADPTDLFGGGAFNPQAILQKEKEFDAEIQRIDKEVVLLKKQNITGKIEDSGQMTMFRADNKNRFAYGKDGKRILPLKNGIQKAYPTKERDIQGWKLSDSTGKYIHTDGSTWEIPKANTIKGKAYTYLEQLIDNHNIKQFDPNTFDYWFDKSRRNARGTYATKGKRVATKGDNASTIALNIYDHLPEKADIRFRLETSQEEAEKKVGVIYNLNDIDKDFREKLEGEGFINLSVLIPDITPNNFHIYTKGEFDSRSKKEWDKIDAPIYRSQSGSKYKIYDGYVYRLSNHWGAVATCTWNKQSNYFIKGRYYYYKDKSGNDVWLGSNIPVSLGRIKLSDLKRKDSAIANPINPEQALIENIEESPDTRFKVDQAASETNTNPSEEQKHAGNYKMGHVAFDGFDISIENPKGSTRSGKDQDGKEWSREMPANYGYFKGTVGKDKDHIDVFIGENPESDKIYVIDQVNPKTGSFDEHKIMLGFDNVSKARNTYNSAYESGWKGLGQITRTNKDGLKEWFKGDTKKPYSSDIRFKITEETTSPEIAALFEKLSALEKVSKKTERAKELTKAVASVKTPEFLKDGIKEKLNTFREGVKAGTKHTKEQIDEIETTLINYIGKNLDLGEAGARDIKSAFTALRNAKRSKRAVEKAFDKIDELTGKVEIKKQKGKNTSHIKRLMDWMKNTDSFVYANNVEFKTFREIDKATIEQQKVLNSPNSTEAQKEAADNELDRMWNELDAKVENRTMLEDVQMKLIEYRRNKTDASPELIAAIREDLQIIYDAAKDSKKGEDIQKAIDRKSDREFVKGLIEPEAKEDAGWLKRVRMTLNDWTISSAGNWETLLNQLGGQKLRDKFSLILNQANQEVSRQATFDKVLDDAKEAYGFKTKEEMLSHLQELKKKDFTLVKPNREGERGEGKDQKLSRMDIMDLYNAIKNENIMNDAYMTYGDISLAEDGSRDTEAQKASGKDRIDGLIENLSDGDKAFADIMQVEAEAYYSKYNRVFIDSYNRDLKKSDNYWPSSAEFANENDAFEQFRQDAMRPSATQERTAHRSVKIADAFDKFVNHVKAGEWYDNMAIPVNRMNNILKNPNVKDLIIEARGEEFYKTMITHLQEQGLNPPSKAVAPTEVESFFGNILNNWVSAAIGLSPSVPVKQLLSVINYSENMPVGKWAAGFAKGLAGPKAIKDTWEEMMKIPYLKTRIGTGYSEALQYVMNADSAAPKAATGWQKMKNIMTGGTRYGDIAAIVFGGKPYLDYLVNEKGMEYQDAVDQFLLDTLRSQQSPFSSSLSTWQNSKEVIKRSIFAFSNTPSQYMRKMFEANEAYRKGDISKGQLAKVYSIYGVLSSANYVIVGALMSALLSGKDWDEDLLEKVLVQFGISTVGGIPIVKDFAEGLGRTLVGLDVYDDVSPLLEGANKVLEISKRLANADEDTDKTKLYLEGIKYLAPFAGISFRNIEKVWNATVNRSKTFDAARVKKTDKTLTETTKSEDTRKAESAKDMKSAYSSAKRKATALKKEGKNSQSDKIIELIETSKANLAKTDYDYIDIGSESRKFNRLFKVYSK